MIVLVAAEKGGVGKSTIASNLAVYLAHKEVDVVLLDTDEQATCARFVERRDDSLLICTES
ncbi:ParA family protein [Ralstonia sp. R-29]|uniref:ParA family protein n=1 Tax=Ralstonia sp. R-29 TaxID=3404059 RepID=UPI003CF4D44F